MAHLRIEMDRGAGWELRGEGPFDGTRAEIITTLPSYVVQYPHRAMIGDLVVVTVRPASERPAFNSVNLAAPVAEIMARSAAKRWYVVLPEDAAGDDGVPVGCRTFYIDAEKATSLASRHTGATLYLPHVTR